MKKTLRNLVLLGILAVTVLTGCSSGGGGKDTTGPPPATPTNSTGTTTISTGTTTNTPTAVVEAPPTVLSKSTDGSSCAVDPSTAISVTFSNDMIASSINASTFMLQQDGALITGTVTYDSSTKTATFKPASPLANSTAYTAKITADARDTAGSAMINDFSWNFTTKQTPAIAAVTPYLMGGSIQGNPLSTFTNVVTTIAGTAGFSGSTDGTGSAARFQFPFGITTDGANLYVADYKNYTIRKIVISTGAVTTIAGSAGFSGSTDGTGSAARFDLFFGITTDGINLYVADTVNSTIRKVVISTGAVTTIAGTAGFSGSTDSTGSAARFYRPYGITTDGTNLYVADTNNNTIRKIVISTGVVTTIAGTTGFSGSTDGTGSAARFNSPYGITTDGISLYVADTNNNTIRKIVISTGVVTTIAGTGLVARFNSPNGITTDGTSLYVSDTNNYTIRKISAITTAPSSSPTNVTTTAGNGQITITWDSVSGANCYNLYCAAGTSVTETTGTEIAFVASPYTYTGLTNGTTYACIETAVNSIGEGPASSQIPSTPVAPAPHTLSVSKSGTGSGTVSSTPSGIDCGSTCTASATNGTTVGLAAIAASGSTFGGWSGGGCSGTGSCTITMDSDKTVIATFTLLTCSNGATDYPTCTQPASGTNYYANWSCNGVAGCISLMGSASGSQGPFCSLNSCNAWSTGSQYWPGICSTNATHTPHPGGTHCYTCTSNGSGQGIAATCN